MGHLVIYLFSRSVHSFFHLVFLCQKSGVLFCSVMDFLQFRIFFCLNSILQDLQDIVANQLITLECSIKL